VSDRTTTPVGLNIVRSRPDSSGANAICVAIADHHTTSTEALAASTVD